MTAFKQVLTNLQSGQREEASIGLEFVLRLDPSFSPAVNLKKQLSSRSDEIDLGDIIAQLQAPTTEAINGLLIEAVDDFNTREFLSAKEKVEKVLIDLPGHQDARDLRDQIEKALKIEGQVGQFLVQAREALAAGDPQEAANFVMMAQALDPHHTGIASTLKEIDDTGGLALSQESTQPSPPGLDEEKPAPTAPFSQEETSQDPFAEQGAFAVEFDMDDPFSDLIDSPAKPPSEFGTEGDDNVSFAPMDDTADLFTAPVDTKEQAEEPEALSTGHGFDEDNYGEPGIEEDVDESVASSIEDLIGRGRAALEAHDQPRAISLWSRVFLLKPAHPEAGHLIEGAKKSLADAEIKAEELLTKARDAYDGAEYDAARDLINQALAVRPNHLNVHILKEELDREQGVLDTPRAADPAATPSATPAVPELPELDDDLFGDAMEEPTEEASASGAADRDIVDDFLSQEDDKYTDLEELDEGTFVDRLRRKMSLRLMIVASVALIVVLAGVWLGGRFLAEEPEVDDSAAVSEVLVEADRLFKEDKKEEALHLLREFPSTGLSQERIARRIAKYEESLTPPTPTPVPEQRLRAQTLLDQGLWWAAFSAAEEGLAIHSDDPGLLEIREMVIEIEPETLPLDQALKTRNYRTAVSITEELLIQYPEQGDLLMVLERSLFNAALAESRAYNLTGAENHLNRLLELKPEDEEVLRFLEFVQKYKVVAADMRLEIFIRSMDER